MRGMNEWLIGMSTLAVIGALAVGCTVDDDEPGTNLGGSNPTGGRSSGGGTGGSSAGSSATETGGGGGAETGGMEAGGAETGGMEAGGAETGGMEAGGAETGGMEAGGAETGGMEAGGAETGGATVGGAGGAGGAGGPGGAGGAVACLGGDDVGALDSAYDDCSDWSLATFDTQQCSAGDASVNGPLADDLCWYYQSTARGEVFDALLTCFAEYSGGTDCGSEHDDFMWDCVSEVGAQTCATTDGTALCDTVAADCDDVTTEFCEGEVNILIETERSAVSDCWASLSNGERTGANCATNFDDCL